MRQGCLYGMVIVSLLLLTLLGSSCGGGEKRSSEPFKGKKASTSQKLKKLAKKKGEEVKFVAKPEWDIISPYFFRFVKELEEDIYDASAIWKFKDAFASHVNKFYPPEKEVAPKLVSITKTKPKKKEKVKKKVEDLLEGLVSPSAPKKEKEEEEITDPLLKYPLDKYAFRIIMTGVSNPEVVVEDPDKNAHTLRLNDKIGSEGGYIQEILKQKVLVRLPDRDEPVIVSLAPETLPVSFAPPSSLR